MQLSLTVKWLMVALVALLALGLPWKGAGADSLRQRLVTVQPNWTGAGHLHGLRDRARLESDLRHRLRHQALRRGHGVRETVVLDSHTLSWRRGHKVIVIERHPFPSLHKHGIFGFRASDAIVLVQPHRLARPHSRAVVGIHPRKVIAHGGHGLFAHRSQLFGGHFGGLFPGAHRRLRGVHPRILVLPGR
jgi:hypothetical protein